MSTITEAGGQGGTEILNVALSPLRILLRHADAGIRGESSVPDASRALTPLGWVQAQGVVGRLRRVAITRVFTSPALRCRQTVVPLARSLRVDIELRAELAIDADPHGLMEFLVAAETEAAVLCTHRETLDRLFALVAMTGKRSRPVDGAAPMAKAAAWTFGPGDDAGRPVIQYLSPGPPPT